MLAETKSSLTLFLLNSEGHSMELIDRHDF